MKIKKFIALILSILIATLNIYIIPLSVEAKGPENYISSYVGTFDGDRPMQFKITSYDTNLQKFTGYLYLNDALIVIDREISGTAVFILLIMNVTLNLIISGCLLRMTLLLI